jgi:hypothetical protein
MSARYLREVLGFDLSTATRGGARIGCSQCAPSVVNGYPLHERGCPHDTRECSGCNARVPANVKYCEECR